LLEIITRNNPKVSKELSRRNFLKNLGWLVDKNKFKNKNKPTSAALIVTKMI